MYLKTLLERKYKGWCMIMKFNFMISIVIPVYNAKDKMAKCLNSLINQSSNNFEVIFIDDCSTDESGKIID